jgi:hypothetical protein
MKLRRPYLASGPTTATVPEGTTAVFLRLCPIHPVYVALLKNGSERWHVGHEWLVDPSLEQQYLKLQSNIIHKRRASASLHCKLLLRSSSPCHPIESQMVIDISE